MTGLMAFREPAAPDSLMNSVKSLDPVECVVVGAGSSLALETAVEMRKMGPINPLLVGARSDIDRAASHLGVQLHDFEIIETPDDEASIAAIAAEQALHRNAGFAVKGSVHTDSYLRGFLSGKAGFRTDQLASHVFHMTAPGMQKPLLISDAAFNVAPTVEQRLSIAANVVRIAHSVGISCPNLAVLSATESVSQSMPSSVEADTIVKVLNEQHGERVNAFGPVAFDIAVSRQAAAVKGYENEGAGNSDILLVPSIETGNSLFKMMVYFSGACAAGIVVGLKIPLVLTSRADPVAARLASIALAATTSRHD